MTIVFCIYDFADDNLPLQPWLTIKMLAEGLTGRGHSVHIVTDAASPVRLDGVGLHVVTSFRGTNDAQLQRLLREIGPDILVCLPTPLNIATSNWLNCVAGCKVVGFASYPFYSRIELLRAWKQLSFRVIKEYLRHALIPGFIWKMAMRKKLDAVIAQSETTANRIRQMIGGGLRTYPIPAGIDLAHWPYCRKDVGRELRILYLGAATAIRGFDLAVEAVSISKIASLEFRILARGADEEKVKFIKERVLHITGGKKVSIVGGWIERKELIKEIHTADIVLQPFLLVPSEFPVTAMEVIACGTPVIGSRIDGLPSAIGPAGTVVTHGSSDALAKAIDLFGADASVRDAWKAGCKDQRDKMLHWNQVVGQWEAVFAAL
ncbi:glycosyltransferase family 4 protein [Desulfomicrobium sp. ZS1]|uniref:glycosyltransferase family 4 protein n=1 Tax=Desulfomicrobium sp. ZS1 TaxID=2952228 RepID=UPI0020B21DC3|nr:glycosyltransferase family 4 protein [Desulfomicrobium sp. ZS1]UTF49422.1 glycosyltransferase family 4 protein [Desulfomicrobium sp. ZS1]